MRLFPLLLLLTLSVFPLRTAAQDLTVTCLANMGVWLDDGTHQVVIDGLFREGVATYATLPEPLRATLETAQPPYDAADVIGATHYHADHFDAAAVARHLRHNPGARFLAAPQLTEQILAADTSRAGQVATFTLTERTRATTAYEGLSVDLLRLRHTSRRNRHVENLAYLFDLGGQTLLHVGDADLFAENFAPFALPARGVDVAMLPFWFLISAENRALVQQHIRPAHIIALHIPPAEAARWQREVRTFFPDAHACTTPGQHLRF